MAGAGRIEVTPQMMDSTAGRISGQVQSWQGAVNKIYELQEEMNAMWDGAANDAFNNIFLQDRPKYDRLTQMMNEYQELIRQAAADYRSGEEEVRGIVSRRR